MKSSFAPELLDRKTYSVTCQDHLDINSSSWCAAVFVRHASMFKQLLGDEQAKKFVSLYNQCVREGSQLRESHGKLSFGENVDNIDVQRIAGIRTLAAYTIIQKEDPSFVSSLPNDLREEFYTRIHSTISQESSPDTYDSVSHNLSFISNGPVMISRHGQSFTIIPLTSDLFVILDSNIDKVGIINKKSLINYIFGDANSSHFHGTFVICEMISETLPYIK
jgi:hypothetical protein